MSAEIINEKCKALIGSDKPPYMLDFLRLSSLPKSSISLLTAAPSPKEVKF